MWFVYILRCADDTFYTGITNNLEKRVAQHNKGKGAKYTKGRTPVFVEMVLTYENRSLASKEEYRIKKLNKKEKQILINKIKK